MVDLKNEIKSKTKKCFSLCYTSQKFIHFWSKGAFRAHSNMYDGAFLQKYLVAKNHLLF